MMQALRKKLATAIYKETNVPKISAPPQGETAWAEDSVLYSARDFEKYNPDILIGRKGYSIYKKMMRDEQVKAVTKFKRDAVTSRGFTFELDYKMEGLTEKNAEIRIDMFYDIIKNIKGSWMDSLNGLMSGMQNGFSMTEKVFEQFTFNNLTYWGIGKLKLKPFDTFTFNVDEYGNIIGLTQKFGSAERKLDIEKFIHFVFNPDVDEHYGQSELHECYRAWFSKDAIYKFRNIWLERHAGGFHTAKVTKGTLQPNTPDYIALQNVLESINVSTGVIVPENIDLEGKYPTNNVAFKEAIEDQDTAIARALLVPNLLGVSPQGDVGSYSQSTSQLEAFFWTLEADTARLEDTLNEQLFKQLSLANFGDTIHPKFKFKPISKAKILELVSKWSDLVNSGAVKNSKADEAYIRKILEMPAIVEEDGASAPTNPDTALNGAQVSSMVEVVSKVAEGVLTKESATNILVAAFPLSKEEASEIVKDIEVKNLEEPNNDDAPKNKGNNNDGGDNGNNDDGSNSDDPGNGTESSEDDSDAEKLNKKEKLDDEETILGKVNITVTAFKRAEKRVAFAVISDVAETNIEEHTFKTAKLMDAIIADLINKAKGGGDVSEDITANVEALKIDSSLKVKLNREITAMLKGGHALGLKHAQNEIDTAKGEDFSRKHSKERIKFIAEDYFKITSFKVTGNLSADAINTITQIILNGSKFGWTWVQIEAEIYSSFATQGMISPEQAKDALGKALNVENPDALLRTMVRTNSFDAVNNARFDYFTDPLLDGFVVGFNYSAILDVRTTQICSHLSSGAGDHSVDWYEQNKQFNPPNHFNCRSLLIAITQVDEDFVEGQEPTQFPQKGFGNTT